MGREKIRHKTQVLDSISSRPSLIQKMNIACFQGTDDGRDFGTWDRQMITEVAVEPGAGDARFSPSTQSTMQLPQRDNSRLTPSPRPDLNPPPPPLHTGSSDPTSRAQPGAGLAPQLIDTSALLHHLNWLQNNPNAQVNCTKLLAMRLVYSHWGNTEAE